MRGGAVCAASGSCAHSPSLGNFNTGHLLAKGPQSVLLPPCCHFYFSFSVKSHMGQLQQ